MTALVLFVAFFLIDLGVFLWGFLGHIGSTHHAFHLVLFFGGVEAVAVGAALLYEVGEEIFD